MRHLTPDELLAAAEADRIPDGHHVEACATCRDEVLALRAIIGMTRVVEVPEPSPLFWDHLSARVRHAVDAVPGPAVDTGRWASWRWHLISGGLAAAVVTGVLVVGRTPVTFLPASVDEDVASMTVPLAEIQAGANDDGLDFELVADAAGNLAADDAGELLDVGAPGASDTVLSALSDEEEQELARLLRAEMEKGRPS